MIEISVFCIVRIKLIVVDLATKLICVFIVKLFVSVTSKYSVEYCGDIIVSSYIVGNLDKLKKY